MAPKVVPKPRRNWAPSGARKGGEEAHNFAPAPIFALFLSLSGCLLVEFWWCLKRRNPSMCAFGVLGLLCEAPAAPKPAAMVSGLLDVEGPVGYGLLRPILLWLILL